MRLIRQALLRLRALFRKPSVERELDAEVRFHLEMETEKNVRLGMRSDEARRRALLDFGGVERFKEAARDTRGTRSVELLLQDARYAARRLVRQPAFSVPAAATLALGTGAAVAVFTLLDAVVLRPLPYPDAERLVRLESPVPGVGADVRWGLARAEFLYVQRSSRSFDGMGLYQMGSAAVGSEAREGRAAEQVPTALVSANLQRVLGARPLIGRAIAPEENLAERPAVAMLTHDLWARRYGRDPRVVGRTIMVGGWPVEIVGVLAPGARLPDELRSPSAAAVGLWLPLWLDPAQPPANNHVFHAVARLRPGVSPDAARAELAGLTARLPEVLPEAYSAEFMRRTGFATDVVPLRASVVGGVARALWIVFGSVALVLLIAAANVANLFLARFETRRREMAVRAALGAGRGDLARHWMAEAALLALAAGGAALALAAAAIRALLVLSPSGIPRLQEVHLGWGGMAFTAALSLGAGALLGALPLAGRRVDLTLLRDAGRGLTPTRRQQIVRSALVVAQIGLSLVLLAGAALLLRSYRQLSAVRPGVDPRGVLTFGVALPSAQYAEYQAITAFYRELVARVEALPGVEIAGLTTYLPLTGEYGCSGIVVEGTSLPPEERSPCVPVVLVAPGVFRALGIPVRGRAPEWGEAQRGATVAVVSEALAGRLWRGESPIGKGLRVGNLDGDRFDVIGVAGDVRGSGLDAPSVEAVYILIGPATASALGRPRRMTVAVRTRGGAADPTALTPAVRRVLAELNPEVPITEVRPMGQVVAMSKARRSFTTLLLALASAIALALSAVGVYGVISYLVAQRRTEIGIRMALGARSTQVGRLVVAQSVRLAAAGVALGLAGALAVTRSLRSLLYGVSPTDPATLAAVSAFLVLLAAAASYVPARRAMRVDPAEALRHE